MSPKNKQPESPAETEPSLANGALGTEGESSGKIRDILFGTQMRDYDDRFSSLERHLREQSDALRTEMRERSEPFEAFVKVELSTLNQRLESTHASQVEALTNATESLQTSLNQAVAELKSEKTDRIALAAMFSEMASRLNVTTP